MATTVELYNSNKSFFATIPAEILILIASHLPNRDIKSLRLTARALQDIVPLRLNRVFLSTFKRDIAVFLAVADHEVFRRQVVEIIWDDTRLMTSLESLEEDMSLESSPESAPEWFVERSEECLAMVQGRYQNDASRPAYASREHQISAPMSMDDCWRFYLELVKEQHEGLPTEVDVEALRYGLDSRFPSLRRITIASASHGFLFNPRYETPTIRTFPKGFIYPILWPDGPFSADDAHEQAENENAFSSKSRGFYVIPPLLNELRENCHIRELIIDSYGLPAGLDACIFEQPNPEYDAFKLMLEKHSPCRLDLVLMVGLYERENWAIYRSGLLRRALAKATNLEHLSLCTDSVEVDPDASGDPIAHHFVPLRTILPIDSWPKLQHFRLGRFHVSQNDLISVLAELPLTLRSVSLDWLLFLEGDYRSLLTAMRNELGWREHVPAERPKVTIRLDLDIPSPGRAIVLDKEVESYLYGDGKHPFQGGGPNQVFYGVGTIVDDFDPDYERPYADWETLQKLGFLKT